MAVGFNPYVSFCAAPQVPPANVKANAQQPSAANLQTDPVELSNKKESKEKKHPVRNFIANVAKFFATTTEMVKGVFKGTAYGLTTGAAILGGSWLFGALPKGFRKGGSLKEVCKNPLKSLSTKSKVIAGAAGLAVLAFHTIAAKLKANQKTANVDHQLKTGHRSV